jgi:DNA-binding MarR family transcriptional regulator
METAGFLHRTRDHRDERVVIIHLTEQGHRLKNRATKIPEQLACHLGFDTADPDTVKAISQLKALLARF